MVKKKKKEKGRKRLLISPVICRWALQLWYSLCASTRVRERAFLSPFSKQKGITRTPLCSPSQLLSRLQSDTAKPTQRSPESATRLLAATASDPRWQRAGLRLTLPLACAFIGAGMARRGKALALPSLEGYLREVRRALSATRERLQEASALPLDGISHPNTSLARSCHGSAGGNCHARSSGSRGPGGVGSFSALLHNRRHKSMDQLKPSAEGKDYFHKLSC